MYAAKYVVLYGCKDQYDLTSGFPIFEKLWFGDAIWSRYLKSNQRLTSPHVPSMSLYGYGYE